MEALVCSSRCSEIAIIDLTFAFMGFEAVRSRYLEICSKADAYPRKPFVEESFLILFINLCIVESFRFSTSTGAMFWNQDRIFPFL